MSILALCHQMRRWQHEDRARRWHEQQKATQAKIALLRAVAAGDGEHGELLLCLDGEPWAVTLAGARLLAVLR